MLNKEEKALVWLVASNNLTYHKRKLLLEMYSSASELFDNFAKDKIKILEVLEITPQELFIINHYQPREDLEREIFNTIKSIQDREKIEIIYKIIKSFV